jgi:hypothetical protein
MQFGTDWPGVFVRGDNAFAFSNYLTVAIAALESDMTGPELSPTLNSVKELRDVLQAAFKEEETTQKLQRFDECVVGR